MYLSCLLIDVGANPDRPRPGRLWLRNLYHVHQRLCMAFPSADRKVHDRDFLKPFKPEDFGEKQVHIEREAGFGFLFRVDPGPDGRGVILVQSGSAIKPDWNYAFHNARYLLAAEPEVKLFDPRYTKGQRLRFRLVANPTRRLSRHSRERDGQPVDEKWIGKRVPVPAEQLLDWLVRRAQSEGFCVIKDSTSIQPGYIYVNKTRDGSAGQRLRSVRYGGVLEVTDAVRFRETLIQGIGPGKAFGFGLLSVAAVSDRRRRSEIDATMRSLTAVVDRRSTLQCGLRPPPSIRDRRYNAVSDRRRRSEIDATMRSPTAAVDQRSTLQNVDQRSTLQPEDSTI
jgi:CRISPR system Cascade subunit CasE